MSSAIPPLHTLHSRHFRDNRFVYPVVSRRSKGISLGVNLNPDKICNFDCIYCQVDRRSEAESDFVNLSAVLQELRQLLEMTTNGELYTHEPFDQVPGPLRRLNDIAFSGDGEPTTYRNFDEIVAQVAALKCELELPDTKLVLITNASMFHRPAVQRGLQILDQNQGEVWAKLDAGTEPYYRLIERTKIPFQQILDNLVLAARARPLVIQSLFMRIDGVGPDQTERDAFCQRLTEIQTAGGSLKLVQVYTVSRRPAESSVTSLSNEEVDAIAEQVQQQTGLATEAYYA
ncbi:MAG: Radical superfamily protein [Planctomycetaceae bacterium]|nr:Radical superfamily protein [Planctomycetaceae bacterium]